MISNNQGLITSKIIGLIFSLSLIFFDVGDSYSSIIFILIMLTIGIPHGSVDHIIAFLNPKSKDQIVENIKSDFNDSKVIIAAPVVKGRKGHYKELFLQIRKKGFSNVRVDVAIQQNFVFLYSL